MALVVGGVLFAVATLLHPSQETPVTILETEVRLVGSHGVWIASYVMVLLGLPALYGWQSRILGRSGLVGYVVAFVGTALLAVSSQFGFLAPVLAKVAPITLDEIAAYPPVVIFNGLAALAFMVGYVLFGTAIALSRVLPRWAGVLVAVGAPVHLVGFGIAQLAAPALWFIPVLGSLALGAGLAWCGFEMWARVAPGRSPVPG